MYKAHIAGALDYELCVNEEKHGQPYHVIEEGVLVYNRKFIKNWFPKPFSLYAKNTEGHIMGGICGERVDIYLKVDWVWVDETLRYQGLGRLLFKYLEKYGFDNNCQYIHLDTAHFQAREFYEKLGFELVATLPDWIGGHDCHFMKKKL